MRYREISPEKLRWTYDPSQFRFDTTDDIPPLEGTIGQERALRSIDFGLGFDSQGFNIYMLGESGTGKTTTIKALLEKKAAEETIPDDWVYVYNFKDPDRPKALNLPPGLGIILQKDTDELVSMLRQEISKAFESKDYEKHKNKILEEYQEESKRLFSELEDEAAKQSFALRKTPTGVVIVPVKSGGEPLSQEEFDSLGSEMKKKIETLSKELQEKLDDVLRQIRETEKTIKEKLNRLERDVGLSSVRHLIDELKSKYREYPKLIEFFDDVKEDALNNLDDFKTPEETTTPLSFLKMAKPEPSFTRYKVNILVNNGDLRGAPVIIEPNPTYYNLFGRIEHKFQYGVALTDFTMIKGGAMHRANGGYLVVNALDLLKNIFAYDAVKRAIRNREIKIEDIWEQYRLISTVTLKPDPIPFNVKIILIGNPFLYYLLYNLDEEYKKLFKVKADFDNRMDRTEENIHKYAAFIATRCKEEALKPFDRTGVAKVVEYGTRLAEHQSKLSARFSDIADIIREANYWASKEQNKYVTGNHVEKAISEKIYRSNKIEEKIRELIVDGTLMVDTEGSVIGQVNGISVVDLGDYSFGKPSRITVKTFAGKSGVVNIEREAKMSGRIHNKGIMILSAYLGGKYAQDYPLSLSASLCFEQLYEEVEGDSATCTELFALLSSLSGLPVKQGIAVTGSMNQMGEVQPVGGINEKIEGFFDVCRVKGLTGEQGVTIPEKNIKNLMLKNDVIEAVREGKFHIYPISTAEEGIEILTGVEAGKLTEEMTYPEGTINYLVDKKLREIAKKLKAEEKEKEVEIEKEVEERR